ncbi:AN1 [Linum grandiflorum]
MVLLASIVILHQAYQAWSTTHEDQDPTAATETRLKFEEYVFRYGRKYKDAKEKEMRFKIFKQRVAKIDAFNAVKGRSTTQGINQFADLTTREMRSRYGNQGRFDNLRQWLRINYSYRGTLWVFVPAAVFFLGYPVVLVVYFISSCAFSRRK